MSKNVNVYRIPLTLTEDISYTEGLIQKFRDGDINAGQLKSNRVPMGIYEQRKNQHYMLRIRCTGGLITPAQLAVVASVGKQVSTSHLHITTRQEIQIHNVDIMDSIPALRKLEKAGLSTQGGGGNTVRNITTNDKSGLTDREAFDVYPYVVELTSRLIAEKDSFSMPRKYKTAFDYNIEDASSSYVADLGLQARIVDGKRGFRVLIAGSTASSPHVGWEVFDFLPEIDLFRAAKALKNWFNAFGNRRNRHKSRMRFVFYKYGEEDAKRFYYDEFNKLKDDASLDFTAPVLSLEHHTPSFTPTPLHSKEFLKWKQRYAYKQTNPEGLKDNLWYAYLAVNHGNNRPEFFAEVADFLGQFGTDVIRFTKREQIQVRNIPEDYLADIYLFFKKLGAYHIDYPVVLTSLTSCTGADTCRLGICLPKGAIDAITKRLLNSDLDLDAIPDFQLNMTGCSNICANSTWADLGFSGRVGRVGDDPYPAYTVWLPAAGKNQINYQQGYVAAKYTPQFTEDYLRDVITHQAGYADYYDYVSKRGANVIKELLAKYKGVPAYSEEPDTYYDWDDDEKFSLIKYGQAECSAGLFDIIEVDQDTIRENLKKLDNTENLSNEEIEKILHDTVFSENRMLLVTRGLDPRTDDDVYNGFITKFIESGIVPDKYQVLTEKARHHKSLAGDKALIIELATLLNNLYKNMDDSLQFKSAEPAKAEAPVNGAPAATVQKDFRGVACPMNFVKTKLALSPLSSGDILEILLDDGQPINNVPGSVRGEGHEVLATEKINDYWKVTIRKK